MISFKQFITEGSEGPAKWEKYFSSGAVDTIAKRDSPLYDLDGNIAGITIEKRDPVHVLASDEYSSKLEVTVNGANYLMKIADIEKPFKINRTVGIDLKPDKLDITGELKLSTYSKTVKKKIDASTELPEVQAEYLKALVDLAEYPDDQKNIEAAQDAYIFADLDSDSALKNTINNDFLEILGPFFVLNEKPEFKGGTCFFPEAGNEPLFDFKMTDKDDIETSFSSKRSGGSTNTLKVSEVLKTAQSLDSKTQRKYSKEIELLTIIQSTPIKTTPDKINDWLAANFQSYKKSAPAGSDNTAIARLEAAVVKFINEQSELQFTPLVKKAIPDLWYVKAKLNNDGTIKVEPLKSGRDIKDVKFRSKSSPGHLSDKIGFAM